MPNGSFEQHLQVKAYKRKCEDHHRNLRILNSLGSKFQVRLTNLNSWNKLTQQRYFRSKKEKSENHHWILHILIRPDFQFQLQQRTLIAF